MNQEENVLRCSSCGAKLIANSLINTRCAYCGSVHFIKEKFNVDFFPESIIRFNNSNKQAEESLIDFIDNLDVIDSKFKQIYEVISVSPIYVPCTIYTLGVDIYVKALRNTTSGGRNGSFYNEEKRKELYSIVQDGSKHINDDFIFSIEPFDFSKMQKFNPAFLSGAYTELNEDKLTKTKAVNKVKKAVLNRIVFDSGILEGNINTIDKIEAYLPIWIANVKAGNKLYNFVMNDTTNKWVSDVERKKDLDLNFKNITISAIFSFIITFVVFGCDFSNIVLSLGIGMMIFLVIIFALNAIFFIKNYSKSNDKVKKFIVSDKDYTINPIESKTIFCKQVPESDVPKDKTTRFYLNGKPI